MPLEDEGYPLGVGGQEDTGARDACRLEPLHFSEEVREGQSQLREMTIEQLRPAMPGAHEQEDARGDRQGYPAPLPDLGHVGAEEGQVDSEEDDCHRGEAPSWPAPALPRQDAEQDR